MFTLTPAGQQTVTRWVQEPTDASMDIHDVALLKISAIELSTPEAIRALANGRSSPTRNASPTSVTSKPASPPAPTPRYAYATSPSAAAFTTSRSTPNHTGSSF